MRGVFRHDRFAVVTSVLALTVAVGGGGGFAVARTLSSSAPTDGTSPILVFSAGPGGKLVAESHRAPVTGKPKIQKVQTGAYWVTIPGIKYDVGRTPAICSQDAGSPATISIDIAGSGHTRVLTVVIQNPTNGFGINAGFKCSVYHL